MPTRATAAPGVERTNWSDRCPSGLIQDIFLQLAGKMLLFLEEQAIKAKSSAGIGKKDYDQCYDKRLLLC